MRSPVLVCGLLMLAGCATIAPPLPPSLELPRPPSDLRAVRKGNKVVLTWTVPTLTTDRKTARSRGSTRICRGVEPVLAQCGTAVGAAPADKNTKKTYSDTLPSDLAQSDSGFATYAVEATNAEGRSAGLSNQVRVPLARTLPPPANFAARVTNEGVALSWTDHVPQNGSQSQVRYVYRIYRRLEGSSREILAGEVAAGSGESLALTDSNLEWEKTYEYRAETVTVIPAEGKAEVQVEGDDSPEVKVFADDVFPPAVPAALQAVYSGAGGQSFIDLIWAPVSDIDLAGYNVYRYEAGTTAVKLNTELVKTPAFRDAAVASGKNYLYSVSAVDVRGNESARSEEAGESVP